MTHRIPLPRRIALSVVAIAAAVTLVLVITVPGSMGAFTAQVSNSNNAATTNAYFSCTTAATGLGSALAWPLDDAGFLGLIGTARDVSGNNRAGNSTLGGINYRQSSTICPRDTVGGNNYAMTFDGSSGYFHYDTAFTPTNTMTVAVWFRTTTSSGGRLIGFGSSNTGASAQTDRMIWLNNAGNVVFGVGSANKTITSASTYRDGNWHQAVATLGTGGIALYVDGAQVAVDAGTTTGRTYTNNQMYLRIAYDAFSGWTPAPASAFFAGTLRFADYFTSTLTAAQVATLYGSGLGS